MAQVIDLAIRITRKRFPSTRIEALRDVEFTVPAGKFIALVGPSGAGKTTILNIAVGLDHEYEGDVRVNSQSLRDCPTHPATTGYMFQDPRLMPWLTAVQNVELVLDGKHDSRARALAMIEEVELAGRADSYPGQLSGGMQRRLALARAFSVRPNLLLMDEPFISLDDPTARRLREQLLRLWRELRPTVLFVTHNLREALSLADQVIFLSASPGTIIHKLPVDIKRPRNLQDPAITNLQEQVMSEHPEILSGLVTDCIDSTGGTDRQRGMG